MSTEISKDVTAPNALDAINLRIAALNEVQSRAPRTDGKFRWNPGYTANDAIDIHRTKDISLLLNIMASLMVKNDSYNVVAESIFANETYPAFEWMGYTYDAWASDIRQRISIVRYHSELQKLEEAKKEISKMLSNQDRLAMILSNLGLTE